MKWNKKEENEPTVLSLLSVSWSWNDENAIDFKWSGVQEEDEEDIALENLFQNYKSKLMSNTFQKSNWMIVVLYLVKRKIKKNFFEVISNTKIFNIKFCSMKLQTTKILPNLQGTEQRRIRETSLN